jgi:hemin uptake protein HemP
MSRLPDDKLRVVVQTRAPVVPRLDSAGVFRGHREVHILHGGETYRLRITRQQKLILTK